MDLHFLLQKLQLDVKHKKAHLQHTKKLIPKLHEEIKKLDVTDTADTTKYVSGVSETDGKISVSRTEFSPSVSVTNTENVVPSISITVAGNNSSAIALPTASSTNYGVVQLTSTYSNLDNTKAITGMGVSNALGTLSNVYVSLETYNQLKADYDALKADYDAFKINHDAFKTGYDTFKAKVESFLNEKYPAGEGELGFAGWTTPAE